MRLSTFGFASSRQGFGTSRTDFLHQVGGDRAGMVVEDAPGELPGERIKALLSAELA